MEAKKTTWRAAGPKVTERRTGIKLVTGSLPIRVTHKKLLAWQGKYPLLLYLSWLLRSYVSHMTGTVWGFSFVVALPLGLQPDTSRITSFHAAKTALKCDLLYSNFYFYSSEGQFCNSCSFTDIYTQAYSFGSLISDSHCLNQTCSLGYLNPKSVGQSGQGSSYDSSCSVVLLSTSSQWIEFCNFPR